MKRKEPVAAAPVLRSGGNPQIPKGDGDGPVQAYIAAMPGWKRDAGRGLDALIERTVPDMRKAVRWNSPHHAATAFIPTAINCRLDARSRRIA